MRFPSLRLEVGERPRRCVVWWSPRPCAMRAMMSKEGQPGWPAGVRLRPVVTGENSPNHVLVDGEVKREQPTRLRILWGESPHAVNYLYQAASIFGACGGNEARSART